MKVYVNCHEVEPRFFPIIAKKFKELGIPLIHTEPLKLPPHLRGYFLALKRGVSLKLPVKRCVLVDWTCHASTHQGNLGNLLFTNATRITTLSFGHWPGGRTAKRDADVPC